MKKALFLVVLIFPLCLSAQVDKELKVEIKEREVVENAEELLKRYYELTHEPGLMGRGAPTVYKNEHLGAIQFPVGGIGAGCIQFDGKAVPRYWQIFNNMGHDFIPNSFFAIRVKDKNGEQVRALQTEDVGNFKGMKALKAQANFPFLKYTFKDDNVPVKVHMEVYNPFIPTNLKDSGIPVVFYQFTVENPTSESLEINLLASQQNAVGYSKVPIIHSENGFAFNFKTSINNEFITNNQSEFYAGNSNRIVDEGKAKILYMNGNTPKDSEHFGQMALVLFNAEEAEGIASWTDEEALYKRFEKSGKLKGNLATDKSNKGQTHTGALNTTFNLKPGEKREIRMALAWYFPNGKNGGFMDKWDAWGKGDWEGNGNKYATHWENIEELVFYLKEHRKRLAHDSKLFSGTFFGSNMPHWLLERIANQLSIIKSRTVFHDKNNYVGLWEGTGGVDGSCAGNCNHVWHYAQSHARLFPEMGKAIRNQAFDAIKENGQIPYRQPAGTPAFDGQCGDILGAYREHLLSADDEWLKSKYPAIKKAVNYLIDTHDPDKDGWLSDAKKHTTYDASMTGNPSFLSSLYLAALRAGEQMALVMTDSDQAKEWGQIADNSAKLQNEKLWNGEYFYQIPGNERATDYENACHSDQLLGQWWADQLGLGNIYPDYKIKKATESILKYNFKSTLEYHDQGHRTFALSNEAGMVVSTWPNNDRPKYASGYSSEVWTTFEYTIGASLLKYGKIRDALTILRSGYDRYDGKLRTGYIGDWGNFGFSGNPFGDDECGQFYGRALSIWSVLLAAQGFEYNGPKNTIGFAPKWKPANHASFFSTAEGWGSFTQNRSSEAQENCIEVAYGNLTLSTIKLDVDGMSAKKVTIERNGERIKSTFKAQKSGIIIHFETNALKRGDKIKIVIN